MAHRSHAGWPSPRVGSWRALIAWLVGCFAVVLAGAIAVGFLLKVLERPDGSTRLDSWITQRVVAHRTDALTSFANVLSRVGSTSVRLPVVAVVAGLLVWRRGFVLAGVLVAVWGGAIGLYDVTKAVVDRPRPPAGIRLASAAGSSFPSGHATQSLATYVALAIILAAVCRPARWAGWVAAGVVAFGVGWSRVYLGMHWTTDVLAGWLIAAVWVALILRLIRPARWRAGSSDRGVGRSIGRR